MEFLRQEARDPRIGMVTVTQVEVTGDLSRAVVRYVVHGDEAARAGSAEGLAAAAVAVRRAVAQSLQLRHTPEIVFHPDRGMEHAARIEGLLSELNHGKEPSS